MNSPHIVIVGGTAGLGRSFLDHEHVTGATLSILGRRQPDRNLDQAENRNFFSLDLTDAQEIPKVMDSVAKQNGPVDQLVFFQRFRGKDDAWAGEIAISLAATRIIIEHLAFNSGFRPDGASVVIVNSVVTRFVAEEQPLSYHLGKAGLEQMVRFYGVTLGRHKIRINSVSFGVILKAVSRDFYLQNKPLHDLYCSITPLGRMGETEDVLNAISFLLGPGSSFITGQDLVVDGGVSLVGHESLARRLVTLDQLQVTRSV